MKILVVGSNGYVGKYICSEILKRANLSLITAIRGDVLEKKIDSSDIVIHSANPSKRFFAKNNPLIDYEESVLKTLSIKNICKKYNKKLILISSISSRSQLDTIYGINRKASESILDETDLILRLGPIYGGDKNIGPLYDIFNNKDVYVDSMTKSAYAHVSFYAKKIIDLSISKNNKYLYELGSKNYLILKDFKDYFKSTSKFYGSIDDQYPNDTFEDSPDISKVFEFFKALKE